MTPTEAAAILRVHNGWHQADDDHKSHLMLDPKLIGEAMDIAAKYIEDNDHE